MGHEIINKSRKREVVDYRHFIMHNMYNINKMSISTISRILGVDRASIYYGIRKYEERKKLYGDDYYLHKVYTPIGDLKDKMFSDTLPSKYKCKDGDWYFCKKTYSFKKKGTDIRVKSMLIDT